MNILNRTALTVLAAALLLSIFGCSKDDSKLAPDGTPETYATGDRSYESYDLDDYVKVGKYTGLTLTIDTTSSYIGEDGTINEAALLNEKMNAVWMKIRETSEVIKYPESQLEDYRDEFVYYYEQAAEQAGMTLEAFMEQNYGVTLEDFETDAYAYAYDCVENDLVFRSIVAKEGLELTSEEYETGLAQFYANVGAEYFETADDFEEYYGEQYVVGNLLWTKMLDWLVANNTFDVAQ